MTESIPFTTKRIGYPDYVKILTVLPNDEYNPPMHQVTSHPDFSQLVNTRLYLCQIWGVGIPTAEFERKYKLNPYAQTGQSIKELNDHLEDLVGLPFVYNHPHVNSDVGGNSYSILGMIVGYIQEQETGRMMGIVRLLDDVQGRMTAGMIEDGSYRGVSITLFWYGNVEYDDNDKATHVGRDLEYIELSLCHVGKQRESCVSQIWEVEPMPPLVMPGTNKPLVCKPFKRINAVHARTDRRKIYQLGYNRNNFEVGHFVTQTISNDPYELVKFRKTFPTEPNWYPLSSNFQKFNPTISKHTSLIPPLSSFSFSSLSSLPSNSLDSSSGFFSMSAAPPSNSAQSDPSKTQPMDPTSAPSGVSANSADSASAETKEVPSEASINSSTDSTVSNASSPPPSGTSENAASPSSSSDVPSVSPVKVDPAVTSSSSVPMDGVKGNAASPQGPSSTFRFNSIPKENVTAEITLLGILNNPEALNELATNSLAGIIFKAAHALYVDKESMKKELDHSEKMARQSSEVWLNSISTIMKHTGTNTRAMEKSHGHLQENALSGGAPSGISANAASAEGGLEEDREDVLNALVKLQRLRPGWVAGFNSFAMALENGWLSGMGEKRAPMPSTSVSNTASTNKVANPSPSSTAASAPTGTASNAVKSETSSTPSASSSSSAAPMDTSAPATTPAGPSGTSSNTVSSTPAKSGPPAAGSGLSEFTNSLKQTSQKSRASLANNVASRPPMGQNVNSALNAVNNAHKEESDNALMSFKNELMGSLSHQNSRISHQFPGASRAAAQLRDMTVSV